MNKIKFRGLAIEDYTGKPITEKKFVYGNVWANEDNSYVIIGEYKDAKRMSNHYVVDPDSVAQLVGYGADGNEVYEGDILIDDNGDEYIAGVKCMAMLLDDNENTFVDVEDLQLKVLKGEI